MDEDEQMSTRIKQFALGFPANYTTPSADSYVELNHLIVEYLWRIIYFLQHSG